MAYSSIIIWSPLCLALLRFFFYVLLTVDCHLNRILDFLLYSCLQCVSLQTKSPPSALSSWRALVLKYEGLGVPMWGLAQTMLGLPVDFMVPLWVGVHLWLTTASQETQESKEKQGLAVASEEAPESPSSQGKRHPPKLRRASSMVLSQNWFETIDQAYFVATRDLELVYTNRKARQLLDEQHNSFRQFVNKLHRVEDPKEPLEQILKCLMQEESIETTCKALLEYAETQPAPTSMAAFKANLFKMYKASICRTKQDYMLIVLADKKQSSAVKAAEYFGKATNCTLSHDLKTLLNGIVGNLELLEEGVPPAFTIYHRIAQSSTHILASKLNDLLDNIQIQNKELRLHYTEFGVWELMVEIGNISQWQAKQKQLVFETALKCSDKRTILGDKGRLKQVLLNLIYKSIDYTDWGTITLHAIDKPNRRLCFKVVSQGSGMHNKLQQQVTSPSTRKLRSSKFANADSLENLEQQALEISQLICHQMQSRIIVKSLQAGFSQLKFTIGDGFTKPLTMHPRLPGTPRLSYVHEANHTLKAISPALPSRKWSEGHLQPAPPNLVLDGEKGSREEWPIASPREEIPSERPGTVITVPLPSHIRSASPKTRQETEVELVHGLPMPSIASIHDNLNFAHEISLPPDKLLSLPRREKVRRTTMSNAICKKLPRASSKCPDDTENCRVLIVDDNATNRCVLKALLKRFSYNSIEANDGYEARSLVEKYLNTGAIQELEVVFMDLQMPRMNGIEATLSIITLCQREGIPAPPIIGVSSDSSEEDREKFMNAGIQEFISKPIDKQKVGYVIGKYMRKPPSSFCFLSLVISLYLGHS